MNFPRGRCAKSLVANQFWRAGLVLQSLALLALFLAPSRILAQPCSVDLGFNPGLNEGADVYAVALQTNGQILIGGSFTSVGGVGITNIARLNPDGSLDTTFNPRTAADIAFSGIPYVSAIAVQPDGRILIGGNFYSSQFIDQGNFTRLNADGTVDTPFDHFLYVDSIVNAILVQPDDKIVIGGNFVVVDFELRRSVARLNSTGTLDYSFDACIASTDGSGATSLALQPDGKIVAGGIFTFSTGVARNGVARLGNCGEVEADFAPEPGIASGESVYKLVLRTDGSILFGGDFRSYHGFARGGLAQLTADGGLDGDFSPGTGIDLSKAIYAIALQDDGRAIIGGNFISYNGEPRTGLARINADGSLEPVCNPGSGPNNSVSSIVFPASGKVLVGGKFSAFNDTPRNAIGRLGAIIPPPRLAINRLGNGQPQWILYGDAPVPFAIEASMDFTNWTTVTNLTPTSSGTPFFDSEIGSYLHRFYRAVSPGP